MSQSATKSILVERLMPHPPAKIWRALTQSPLIAEWLMKNDFKPVVGHRFQFHAKPMPGWKGYTNCEVLEVDEPNRLVYSWGDGTESDSALTTVVTWTLTPAEGGTLVQMQQAGFKPADEYGFQAMSGGWPRILASLEREAGMLA
ncbi:SRPBCC family protein [Hoeflea sp.]|uniref:SRPBCC family protein n=1 Tax=Hoeflea sp. TaxID=1940281 RepID=UPI003A94B282